MAGAHGRYRNAPKPVFASGTGVSADWGNQSPPALVSHRILPNQRLPTRSGEIGTTYLFGGFSEPESDCTWIAGERGIIEFTIDSDSKDTQSNYEIILEASGRRSLQHGREQHCTVALNGKVIAYLRVPESETLLRLAVPMQRMGHPSRFRLELIPDHSDQVFDAEGHVTDERRLSICLKSIEIRCDVVGKPPLLEAGVMYECREGSEGARALFSGFHAPEENLSWIAGTRGTLRFGMECHLKIRYSNYRWLVAAVWKAERCRISH